MENFWKVFLFLKRSKEFLKRSKEFKSDYPLEGSDVLQTSRIRMLELLNKSPKADQSFNLNINYIKQKKEANNIRNHS